jgi:hypothetical protein
VAENAWKRLRENKNDEIEDTFCFQLFEMNYFSENLFASLCKDMEIVLEQKTKRSEDYMILVWIISGVFRSVFSHYDKADLYKIENFDADVCERWSGDYLEKLRSLLEKIFSVVIE